jgi:hypothetical protein
LKALKIQEKRREPKEQQKDNNRKLPVKSFNDKSRRTEEMAIQRTKRLVDREGLKPLPKKLGVKIRHKDMKVCAFSIKNILLMLLGLERQVWQKIEFQWCAHGQSEGP